MSSQGDARAPAVDRLFATLGFRLQQIARRRLPEGGPLAPPSDSTPAALRYRLRRDGFPRDAVREVCSRYAAAMAAPPPPRVTTAAARLVRGGLVELARFEERAQALGMAALVRALAGERVHLLAASTQAAQALADRVRGPLGAHGLELKCLTPEQDAAARRQAYAAPVVCGGLRDIGMDYLRDGLQAGERRGALRGALDRVSGDPRDAASPMMPALDCALVADADAAMLDGALAPLVIGTEADTAGERLLYDQAMELARALGPGEHFDASGSEMRLTAAGRELLERLLAPLGGVWGLPERREQLVARALTALHVLRAGTHYRVDQGRVVFPDAPQAPEEPDEADEELKRLVEVKEGCRLSARRVILGRLSVPRFLRRYAALAGVCADARGVEDEFWRLYGLKTFQAGSRPAPPAIRARVFLTADARDAAKQAARSSVVDELPPSRRVLAALCERAGQPLELLLALEDEALGAGRFAARAARLLAGPHGELPERYARWIVARALRRAEREGRILRRDLAAREQMLDDLLAFSGRRD